MTVRRWVVVASVLMVAIAVCRFRFADNNAAQATTGSMPSKQFAALWKHDMYYNYRPRENNGSIRGGLQAAQVTPEARQIAFEYKTVLYPRLKACAAKYRILPQTLLSTPGFKNAEKYYLQRPDWSIGLAYRLDGTMISHDLTSGSASNSGHDPWAYYHIRLNDRAHQNITVTGWDDGTVTFDPLMTMYHGISHRSVGAYPEDVPPGASGIPASTRQWKQLLQPSHV